MEKIGNRLFENEDDSHSLLAEQDMEKEIELGLQHCYGQLRELLDIK